MNNFGPSDAAGAGAPVAKQREVLPNSEYALKVPDASQGAAITPLRRYWRALVKRRLIIGGVVLLCVLVALAVTMMTQRMYSSVVVLEIAREADRVVEMDETDARRGSDPEFYQTQYTLLKSRSLAEAVVRSLRLDRNEEFLSSFGQIDLEDLPEGRQARVQLATGIVMANTEVVPVRLSSVVNVRYNSPDPVMAARVANAIAKSFIQSNLERRFEASAYARTFLQGRLEEMRRRLEDSERQAVAYAGQNEIINVAPTSTNSEGQRQAEQSLVSMSLSRANMALAEAKNARIAAESKLRESRGRAPREALENPTLNALRQQRAELSAQLQNQRRNFGPDYPVINANEAQLAELDRQISVESGRVTGAVSDVTRSQYEEAVANERQLASLVAQLKGDALDLRRRSIQYEILQRDVDTNRSLYDALLQRYREVGIAGGVGTNNVSIIDVATPPGAPYRPNIMLNIILALLAGTVLGAALALLLDQLDEYAVVPDDFSNELGIPLLGSVPVVDAGNEPGELLGDAKSPISEAYFSILTALRFSTSHGTPKTLLTTSTQPSEGKSTTAFALAQSLARAGNRVLLIDSDMRNPSVHKALGMANASGFSNLLIGEGTIEQHAVASGLANLWVLTSGPIPPNPAELLASRLLDEVLEQAASRYDHVVVDAPPVLGLADAPLLARAVEATVFIVESSHTRISQARNALNRLIAVQAPIAGAVLTKLDAKGSGLGYGYGYDYSYGRNA